MVKEIQKEELHGQLMTKSNKSKQTLKKISVKIVQHDNQYLKNIKVYTLTTFIYFFKKLLTRNFYDKKYIGLRFQIKIGTRSR